MLISNRAMTALRRIADDANDAHTDGGSAAAMDYAQGARDVVEMLAATNALEAVESVRRRVATMQAEWSA